MRGRRPAEEKVVALAEEGAPLHNLEERARLRLEEIRPEGLTGELRWTFDRMVQVVANMPSHCDGHLPVQPRVLQSAAPALCIGLEKSGRFRTASGLSEQLGRHQKRDTSVHCSAGRSAGVANAIRPTLSSLFWGARAHLQVIGLANLSSGVEAGPRRCQFEPRAPSKQRGCYGRQAKKSVDAPLIGTKAIAEFIKVRSTAATQTPYTWPHPTKRQNQPINPCPAGAIIHGPRAMASAPKPQCSSSAG